MCLLITPRACTHSPERSRRPCPWPLPLFPSGYLHVVKLLMEEKPNQRQRLLQSQRQSEPGSSQRALDTLRLAAQRLIFLSVLSEQTLNHQSEPPKPGCGLFGTGDSEGRHPGPTPGNGVPCSWALPFSRTQYPPNPVRDSDTTTDHSG